MTPTPAKARSSWKLQLARAAMLVFVIALTWFVYNIRDRADVLQAYGYPGIFLLSVMASATIVLPAPGLAFVYGAGALLNPLGVGVAAGLGATLGELSGYMAGFSGQAIIENRALYEKLVGWMQRYGAVTIAVLGFLPLPFFDLAGVAAGALKMPVARFLLFCSVGKIPKMLLVALAGSYSLEWIARLFQ
jgi:membrane protein YqaA with SNARE-associated domain